MAQPPTDIQAKLRQMADQERIRKQLKAQYEAEMAKRYTRDVVPFAQWMSDRNTPGMAKGGQRVLPPERREQNLTKFLEPSAEKRRMYHGTRSAGTRSVSKPGQQGIEEFKHGLRGMTFVSPDPKFANSYAGASKESLDSGAWTPTVYPVHVQVKNPFDYENPEHIEGIMPHLPFGTDYKWSVVHKKTPDEMRDELAKGRWEILEDGDVVEAVRKAGHDAMYMSENGVKNLGVFNPKAIKSATGNRGTYDTRKADINKAGGGKVKAPKSTVKAYKLFRVDERQPGKLFPLFVDANTPVKMGEWVDAIEGSMANGKVKSKIGPLAYRPGWHAGDLPIATHIGEKSDPSITAPDTRPANHAWAEVEMPNDVDWQTVANQRGTNAQGKLVPVKAHITDQLPKGGHYRYKTNSNMTGNWLIGGSMKVNRVLSDAEVAKINKAAGLADLPRAQPFKKKVFGFAGGGSVAPQEWIAEEHVNHMADGGQLPANKRMIEDVYSKYPAYPFNQRQRAMVWDAPPDDQHLGIFELEPSGTSEGDVEVKWIAASPHKQGAGSKTMQALQQHAREHGVGLTLYPWDKGRVSQAKLTKFYKKHGFAPMSKGSKNLIWRPEGMAAGGLAHMAKGGTLPANPSLDTMKLALTRNNLGMHSPLEKSLINVPRTKGTAQEFMTEASKQPGFKKEEVEDRGLQLPQGKLTKEQFLAHVQGQKSQPIQVKVHQDEGPHWEAALDRAMNYEEPADEDDDGTHYMNLKEIARQEVPRTDYHDYQIPGGKNYREVLLHMPPKKENWQVRENNGKWEVYSDRASLGSFPSEIIARDEQKFRNRTAGFDPGNTYNSSHWTDTPNVLAHIRMSDRTGPNGEKILHVEEVQSDWHQAGRKEGYSLLTPEENAELQGLLRKEQNEDGLLQSDMARVRDLESRMGKGVPDAPHKKSWHELALKHALTEAVKGKYHGIAITPGEEQADRYDLSKQIGYLGYNPEEGRLKAYGHDRREVMNQAGIKPEDIENHIGKEAAKRLLEAPQLMGYHQLEGENIKVGGEGMKGFYDKIVPDYLNKLGKKHGAQVAMNAYRIKGSKDDYGNAVEQMGIADVPMESLTPEQNQQIADAADKKLHYFPITPSLRQQIKTEGLPQYQMGGMIHKATGGAIQGTTMNPTMAQMRASLMRKPMDIRTVGVQEAIGLSPKLFLSPDSGVERGQMPPPGGVATPSGMPIGGIDMSMQPGQQLMPQMQQPQQQMPGMQPQGGQQAPQMAPDQPSNILQMTPQGQAMSAIRPPQQPMQPQRPPGMAKGGRLSTEQMAAELMSKASRSAGMKAPVTAAKNLNTMQDFHQSLGDRIRKGAADMQDLMESMPFKYEKGHRVFTKSSAERRLPPYTVLARRLAGNSIVYDKSNGGMKAVIDPQTGKSKRTPYEPGYIVRHEMGPDDWQEFTIPESAILGKVELAAGGSFKGYLHNTDINPNPLVGKRYKTSGHGVDLAPINQIDVESMMGGSFGVAPWDTSGSHVVEGVSGHKLINPAQLEGGQNFPRKLKNIEEGRGGASGQKVVESQQDRISRAISHNLGNKGTGKVYTSPSTMAAGSEYFSHMPIEIQLDLMTQAGLHPEQIERLNQMVRAQKGMQGFVGFDHPKLWEYITSGDKANPVKSVGNMRKAMSKALSSKEGQQMLNYNEEDLLEAIRDPDLRGTPKGYAGRILLEGHPNEVRGTPFMSSNHTSYSSGHRQKFVGGAKNAPVELWMPDSYEATKAKLIAKNKALATKPGLRDMVLNTLAWTKDPVGYQPINDRVVRNIKRFEEGQKAGDINPNDIEGIFDYYKRKHGGYKKGGKVAPKQNMDTMRLALTKKAK